MPPDAVWSELVNKSEIKSNRTETGWKNLMNECLMGAEIYKKKENGGQECLRLDPNLVMDMRHRMIKEYPKTISLPQAQIHSEALKLLREKNHDKLMRVKEIKLIEKEVAKLKQTLENRRLSVQIQLEETTNQKTNSVKNCGKLWKNLEFSDKSYEMNIWFGRTNDVITGTKMDANMYSKYENAKNNFDERESKETFSENKTTNAIKINQNRVRRAWTAWKFYAEKNKNRNKIETFLSKLKEKNKTEKFKTNQLEKQNDSLKKLMDEVKASKTEACQKLQEIAKPRMTSNPKFLQKMEERREERLKRKKVLEDKKRKLEEEREKVKKEIEEEKKREEEDNKRKKIEEEREKRRIEKEKKLQKERQRQKLRSDTIKAENYCKLYVLKTYGLRPWLKLMELRDFHLQRAVAHFEGRLKQKVLRHWLADVQVRVELKRKLANEFFEKTLKKNSLLMWVEFRKEKVKQDQVAVDWNELRVTERAFKKWLKFTLDEQTLYLETTKIARLHYERKLKSKYLEKLFYYPEVKRLERERENRKRMWREKIREIIPDYQPVDLINDF